MSLNVGLVGATGMVGEVFLKLLTEENFPINELRPFASESSAGKPLTWNNKDWPIQALKPNCFAGLDIVFFSSGDEISKEWAPQAAAQGAFAIDNSNAFRMDENVQLIVPEINGAGLSKSLPAQIIANPNCSTIQLVMALQPLVELGLSSVQVASYQSVSGGGKAAVQELIDQLKAQLEGSPLPQPSCFTRTIAFNSIPQIGSFQDGFCTEELKIMRETKKILSMPDLKVSAFTVRVPSLNGHSEAVWVDLDPATSKEQILSKWEQFPNLKVFAKDEDFPTVLQADENNDTLVGRLHKDPNQAGRWMFWVVSDNLRKGAAFNGLQIAQHIFDS